jgi:two-component system, cell cycle sensor histidine kinase and response regulator CckA
MSDPVDTNLPPTPVEQTAAMPPAAGDAVIRVLLIEDDEDDFVLTRDLLGEIPTARFELEWVGRYEQGLDAMRANRHDVYLVDYRLGERTGLDLLREARAGGCDAPVILLTGQHEIEIDLAAMRAGAADYLVKGQIAAPLLERSIRYSLAQHRTLEALRHREEQLRHAQKMEAIGRLAGGVAHDFNNVLTAVTGYTDLVLERIEDEPDAPSRELTSDVREIRRAAMRATSLTRQLLTFSRRQGSEVRVLSIGRVIGELESMLQRLIGADVELVTRVEPGLANVKADRGQLEQVVMNLTVNARDAMPSGGRLTIAARDVVARGGDDPWHPGVPPGRYALLSVADTGVGMDEQTLARIFEPFFTTKGPDKGTGLGLSTVYAIVSGNGGHTRVESAPDRGTTFYIYLPA